MTLVEQMASWSADEFPRPGSLAYLRVLHGYIRERGVSYEDAVRHLDLAQREAARPALKPLPVAEGGPLVPSDFTNDYDVNTACGHFLGNLCGLCGVCSSCDGCYCREG